MKLIGKFAQIKNSILKVIPKDDISLKINIFSIEMFLYLIFL
jgi:hypothetical protein